MLDIKFLRENPDIVKQNIKNKFQDSKLPMVDEVIELDAKKRDCQQEADSLRANRNKISKQIGALMAQGKKKEAEEVKKEVAASAARLSELEEQEKELDEKILKIMMVIPNIIDPSVPIGKDDSENVEVTKYGEPVVPDFEITFTEISFPASHGYHPRFSAVKSCCFPYLSLNARLLYFRVFHNSNN